MKRGRVTIYTEKIATRICERLADGESLLAICKDDDMPAESTVRKWALHDFRGFGAKYTRAREIGYLHMGDELVAIADTPQEGVIVKDGPNGVESRTGDMIDHRRLRVDTRKWMLARMLPKVFGDKLAIDQTTEMTVAMIDRPERETREQWVARRQRELGLDPRIAGPTQGNAD